MPREVEIILTIQLASYLSTPAFLIDPRGDLVFYNEAAEGTVGHRFDEAGELPAEDWSTLVRPTDEAGTPLPTDHRPIMVALATQRPAHGDVWITDGHGVRRRLIVTAMPIVGAAGFLGVLALFWEAPATGG